MSNTPIEIVVVVEGGCCREVYVPNVGIGQETQVVYHILDIDSKTDGDEPVIEIGGQSAVNFAGSLDGLCEIIQEEYS